MRRGIVVAVLVAGPVAGLLAGCGASTTSSSPAPEPTTSPAVSPTHGSTSPATGDRPSKEPKADGTRIITAGSDHGRMLYDGTGQPIYLFDVETGPRPRCYGECAAAWPPVLTTGRPQPGAGVRKGLLGSTPRTDGTTQVTYAGHPLYFYAHEGKYEVLCHDVVEHGGTWLVVRPDGTPAP